MQDVIEREITVRAPQERVYKAITDPNQITEWFPDKVEGNLEPGERPVFVFEGHDHRAQTYIEEARPFEYFSYRWVPGGQSFEGDVLDQKNTLVEFFITPTETGSQVVLKESGFSSLPQEVAEQSFQDNNGGWDFMMERLEKVLNS